jgi:HlyD family secretion protein
MRQTLLPVLLSTLLVACSETAPPAPPPVLAVTTATAAPAVVSQHLVLPGRVVARRAMAVGTEVPGRVRLVTVEPGEPVTGGSVVVEMADDGAADRLAAVAADLARAAAQRLQAIAQQAEAEAQLAEAQALRTEATQARVRSERLAAEGHITTESLEARIAADAAAAARLRAATDRVRAAAAALSLAEADIRRAQATADGEAVRVRQLTVKAPAAGLVLSRSVDPGQVVSAGDALLTIAMDGELEIACEVPEHLTVISGSTARIGIDGRTVNGRIRRLDSSVDAGNRSLTVRIAPAESADLGRVVGRSVIVRLEVGREWAPRVPLTAIRRWDPPEVAMVVDGRIHLQRVVLGGDDGEGIAVRSGLAPDAVVVALVPGLVEDGDVVTTVAAP